MFLKAIICLIIGYIFGLFQTGFVYGKLVHKVDIREFGSHNSGATNTVRTLGKGAGYIVFLGDAFKMVIAVLLVRFVIFPGQTYTLTLSMITAVGVLLGHDFPFYMGFKGGKGISSTGGLFLALHPILAVIGAISFLVTFFATKYVSVGSLVMTAIFPFAVLWVFHGNITVFLFSFAITALDWWQHRANIARLMNGTENRFDKKKKS